MGLGYRTKATIEEGIANEWTGACSTTVVCYEPGNRSRYALVLVDLSSLPDGASGAVGGSGYLVTEMVTRRSAIISPDSYVHPGYLADKLGVSENDGAVIAELLKHLIGCDAQDAGPETPE